MSQHNRPSAQAWVNVLLDKEAPLDLRDDAAMDLAGYDDPVVLPALIKVGSDSSESEQLREQVGETIAQIWFRKKMFDEAVFEQLDPHVKLYVAHARPET